MNEEVTRDVLREMEYSLWGKRQKEKAVFTTGHKLDVDASKAAGKRVSRSVPYIAITYPGQRDFHSKPATQAQIQKYPEAFAKYQEDIRRGNQEPYEGWVELGGAPDRQEHGEMEEGNTVRNLEHLDFRSQAFRARTG